jgi:Nup53/35/40-type RNA recognition motif
VLSTGYEAGNHENDAPPMPMPSTPWTDPRCWVLVFGFHSAEQCDEIVRLLGGGGADAAAARTVDIVQTSRQSRNRVAIQYASPLQAAKILARDTLILRDGTLVGIRSMDNTTTANGRGRSCGIGSDVRLLMTPPSSSSAAVTIATTTAAAHGSLWQPREEGPTSSSSGDDDDGDDSRLGSAGGTTTAAVGIDSIHQQQQQRHQITENDILLWPGGTGGGFQQQQQSMTKRPSSSAAKNGNDGEEGRSRSVCEILLRWILSIDDDDAY